jgi:hypothetical protein
MGAQHGAADIGELHAANDFRVLGFTSLRAEAGSTSWFGLGEPQWPSPAPLPAGPQPPRTSSLSDHSTSMPHGFTV